MKIEDFGEFNFNDMLAVVEDEMLIHIDAIETAREGIGQLFQDIENMSEYICYLESLLKLHEIDYCKHDF